MSLKIITSPNRTADLIRALRLHLARTQVRPGCLKCSITQDAAKKNIVLYEEEWSSWKELEQQVSSERFLPILELMEQSSNTPELIFNDVQETRGIEYVRKVRGVTTEFGDLQ